MTKDRLKSIAPRKNNQKVSAFRNGNATSLAPICNGTITLNNPNMNGIAMNRIMIVPCVVKT
ncbi:hypothetical protein D3C74_500920 [compost metagenome]